MNFINPLLVCVLLSAPVMPTWTVRHPVITKTIHVALLPVTWPYKQFAKTKIGGAVIKETKATEQDLSNLLEKVNGKVSPYTNAASVGASGFTLYNTIKLMQIHH